jgi:hypothetical protein
MAFITNDGCLCQSDCFGKEDQSVATLALLPDADGETLIQSSFGQMGLGTYKNVSALRVWAQVVAIALLSFLVLSSLFFAPVWIWKKLSGKLHNAGPLSVRIMPLLGQSRSFPLMCSSYPGCAEGSPPASLIYSHIGHSFFIRGWHYVFEHCVPLGWRSESVCPLS